MVFLFSIVIGPFFLPRYNVDVYYSLSNNNLMWTNVMYKLKVCVLFGSLYCIVRVSEWLLFNANSSIFQLYNGENKLIFNEMRMMSALY